MREGGVRCRFSTRSGTRSFFGETMRHAHCRTTNQQHVLVRYMDGDDAFWLAPETTLAELAARISCLSETHSGEPLTINVRLEAPVMIPPFH
jgi:hypothetical protein